MYIEYALPRPESRISRADTFKTAAEGVRSPLRLKRIPEWNEIVVVAKVLARVYARARA